MKKFRMACVVLSFLFVLSSCTVMRDGGINEHFYDEVNIIEGQPLVTEIMQSGGVPRIFVNKTPIMTNALFVNTDIWSPAIETQIRMAYENGVRLFSTICYLSPFTTDFENAESVKQIYASRLRQITDVAKDAVVILRVDVGSYSGAFAETENEKNTAGTISDRVSIGSEKWAKKVVLGLNKLTTVLRADEDACSHVAIIHLDFQEFFQRSFPDVSLANTLCFSKWLEKKYVTDENLASAWGEDVSFSSAYIPKSFSGEKINLSLYSTAAEQKCVDYYEYISDITAQRIESFSQAIKQASDSEMGVIAFYGYYFELTNPSSGHFSMERLLRCPYIDGFAAPVSYLERNSFVSTSAYMSVVDSVARNNKIWFQESDQRTTLSYDENPTSDGLVLGGTEEIIKKQTYEHGMNLVHAAGTWQMDLMSKGWLADEAIWKNIKRLDTYERAYAAATDRLPVFDVVFVFDEAAQKKYKDSAAFEKYIQDLKKSAYRLGVSVGFALTDDVISGKFDATKLFIFVNPWAISVEDCQQLEKVLHKRGVTSVFYHSFGALPDENVKSLTGMEIEKSELVRPFSVSITPEGEGLGFSENLLPLRFLPRPVIVGGSVSVLGKYGDGTEVAFAMHEQSGYKILFRGEGLFSENDLYALCDVAGVNVFSRSSDNFSANQNFIVFQAVSDGEKTISFDRQLDVYDIFEGKWYENMSSYSFAAELGEVKWLLYGTKSRIEKYIGE